MFRKSRNGFRKLLLTVSVCAGMAGVSTTANAITFDFASLADPNGNGGANESTWATATLSEGLGVSGGSFNFATDIWTVGIVSVLAYATNNGPNPGTSKAYLDAVSGGQPAGLGVCSTGTGAAVNEQCGNSADDNAGFVDDGQGGNTDVETLILRFNRSVLLGAGTVFRDDDHNVIDGTGILIEAMGGNTIYKFSRAAVDGVNFYLSTLEVTNPGNNINPIPLPATLPLFGGALALMGLLGWRRNRKSTVT